MNSADSLVDWVEKIRWDDADVVSKDVTAGLRGVAGAPKGLQRLLEAESARVERFPNFFKLVLWEFSNGSSMRLHLFPSPGIGSRHSHRWVFGSCVIAGRLRHSLFEEDIVYASRPVGREPLVMSREEIPGVAYALWPSHVHSIEALEPSLTVVLRGPEVRHERFVDVPGLERGWARRYARVDPGVAGGVVSDEERGRAIGLARSLIGSAAGSTPC